MDQNAGWQRDANITTRLRNPPRAHAQRIVASAGDLATAGRAVHQLTEGGIPARSATVVGCDLRTHPRPAARWPSSAALVHGGALGLAAGALTLGLLVTTDLVEATAEPTRVAVSAAAGGAVTGSALRAVGHGLSRGRRAVPIEVHPHRYAVLVDTAHADHAAHLLRQGRATFHAR
ncbi:hypothetical protein [Actinoplanes palleronii]|uniref:Uncharacterized protein n=1 Tax=Actinoplanes palleronii TaxID=113570 RepID=A0ABQ4BGS9_9ACTN|nr:hypothetical protein [Actinoplanes palleronii]GIE69893.1 hypothetical protein Apa02nite_060010 [Actinoplanes palleronii]